MNTDPSTPENDANLSALGRELLETGGSKPSSGPWVPPTAEELHKLLPEYEIVKMLGRGGMGAVYMGRQISLDRPVAIKILSNALEEADASFAERFKNEAKAMGKLSHPGIVAVHDFGETASGLLYIVMEYVEGTDVARMIAKEGRLHTDHAMAITAHVCDALGYAHERGIIHRDIKPANIMVGYDGVVKVADFGLAKMTQSPNTGLTQSGMAMGTLHYMAPEALMLGSGVDHRADIYAVGVMLYQMLTGKIPQGMFGLPSLQVSGLDPRYDGIIAKALREDREVRYQSVGEMRRDLDGILTQPVVKVEAEATQAPAALSTQDRPQRPGGKQPYRPPLQATPQPAAQPSNSGWVWAVVVVVMIGVAVYVYALFDRSGDRIQGEQAGLPAPAPLAAASVGALPASVTPQSKSAAQAPAAPSIKATKEAPFVNSLGMKFVPVPITGGPSDGQKILFCIWETRVRDFAAFIEANANRAGTKPNYIKENDHPVVNVSWEEAVAFCRWLTEIERKEGRLGIDELYRLPTDHEWSCAVGIGEQENAESPPNAKKNKLAGVYPWGESYPPPKGSGNYYGEETKQRPPYNGIKPIEGYDDGFVRTAPVGSFQANRYGLYDIGGNVWELCNDWIWPTSEMPIQRGNAWVSQGENSLRSAVRNVSRKLTSRYDSTGFRVVLEATGARTAGRAASPRNVPPTSSVGGDAAALTGFPDFRTRVANYQKARHAQLSDLSGKYRSALASARAEATKGGVLADVTALDDAITRATALADEIEKNLTSLEVKPLSVLPQLSAAVPQRLKDLRAIFEREIVKIETTLVTSLDQSLATVQASLTQAANLTAAKAVEEYRKQVMAAFPKPRVEDAAKVVGPAGVTAQPAQSSTSTTAASNGQLLDATKDKPFVNSLGMKFVPVPGTKVLMCIHETRRRDFAAFDPKARNNIIFHGLPVNPTDDHPAIALYNEAERFHEWLSQQEQRRYRLPTDREWSIAVGIGDEEDATRPALELSGRLSRRYPWGRDFPPRQTVANIADSLFRQAVATRQQIVGYTDGHAMTAPVMTFPPNELGLYDLAGNLWEACVDDLMPSVPVFVLRGGCFLNSEEEYLNASKRTLAQVGVGTVSAPVPTLGRGFRSVIELP